MIHIEAESAIYRSHLSIGQTPIRIRKPHTCALRPLRLSSLCQGHCKLQRNYHQSSASHHTQHRHCLEPRRLWGSNCFGNGILRFQRARDRDWGSGKYIGTQGIPWSCGRWNERVGRPRPIRHFEDCLEQMLHFTAALPPEGITYTSILNITILSCLSMYLRPRTDRAFCISYSRFNRTIASIENSALSSAKLHG